MAIPEDYLAELEDDTLGLANHITREIFNHILKRYAKITHSYSEWKQQGVQKSMDPTKPNVVYTKNHKKYQTFAIDAKEHISGAKMVKMCSHILLGQTS